VTILDGYTRWVEFARAPVLVLERDPSPPHSAAEVLLVADEMHRRAWIACP
jgi:hypothetical protein